MPAHPICRPLGLLACALLLVPAASPPLRAAAPDRAALDNTYRQQLEALAAKCEELDLPEQARQTREWFVERRGDRQYLFVPPPRDPLFPKPGASDLVRKWHARLLELREAQADRLVELSKQYLAADDPTRAYQALYEALREHPQHAEARRVLGYVRSGNNWRLAGQTPGVKRASLRHSYLAWPAGGYWHVNTPNFHIVTSAGPDVGERFGEQLELLHTVWRQVFFRYWSSQEELAARMARPQASARLKKPFEVVLFKNREEYLANLAQAEPRLAVTQGIYLDGKNTAFFYAGDDRTEAICYHEATHQLFQETGTAVRHLGSRGNFWIVEGIALYMESLARFDDRGYVTLGGWESDRLQFARHHVYNGQFQIPLDTLVGTSREALQKDSDIKRIYSQAAGLAHYLMDADKGRYREATVTYLAGIYAGRDERDALMRLTATDGPAHDAAYRAFLRVTDDDLARMPAPERVRNLSLGHQPISDAGLEHLARCERLEWLDLAATKVTDGGLKHLAGLQKLEQLNLEQTAAGDATLDWLAQRTRLRELDLSHTQVTDAGLERLGGLRELTVLWLTSTGVTDASIPVLSKLKKLELLDTTGTGLSPAGMDQLKKALPKLRE